MAAHLVSVAAVVAGRVYFKFCSTLDLHTAVVEDYMYGVP